MATKDAKPTRATVALVLLILINLFNYIDRQVLSAVESRIEETFFPEADFPYKPLTEEQKAEQDKGEKVVRVREDPTIEGQMGFLNTAFMVTYILIAPLFGLLADRMPRWTLVGIGVIGWSLATGATGLAGTFAVMVLTRCLVGVGEAAYGPVAPTMISDLYPVEKRGKMMSYFYAAIPVGSALGYVLGGQMTSLAAYFSLPGAEEGGDWRWAFYVVVPPGLLLGLWCFFMREPSRSPGASEAPASATGIVAGEPPIVPAKDDAPTPRKATWADYMMILQTPSYLLNTLGMTAMTFALGGMAFWMPRFAFNRGAGGLDFVNTVFGLIVVVSGLLATMIGGMTGDWLRQKLAGAYFFVAAVGMTLAFPLTLCAIYVPFPFAWIFVFLACFCLFFNVGPTNTILANVTHPSIRASAFAMNILIIHAFGDAISPMVIGFVNGYAGDMSAGFFLVSLFCLVSAGFWLLGMRYLKADTDRVEAATHPGKP